MAKKKTHSPTINLASAIDEMLNDMDGAAEYEVVDIITFCEDPRFLNFSGQGMELWPMQRIVLKMFYRGTRGNEHIQLTEEEIRVLEDIAKNEDLDYKVEYGGFSQVIEKYHRWTPFRTLQLIMGRRSSKTMMVSIIAAYEAYKLLVTPGGDPHKFYGLPPEKPIAIINVAVSEQQAYDPLFLEVQARINNSPFFQDKINHKVDQKGRIYLLTDSDKKKNAERKEKGQSMLLDGSIILMSGHSNSASLRGKAAICILFDEIAHFLNTSGKQSADEVYNALVPSTQQFGTDGKIVLLSDPRGKDGIFHRLFEMSQERLEDKAGKIAWPNDNILSLQLPTWRMNPDPNFGKDFLETTEKNKDPLAFMSSWAARFVGEEGKQFFIPEKVDECVDFNRAPPSRGDYRYAYHIHLDPATTSHNYALCLCHAQPMINQRMIMKRRIVVDYVKIWKPSPGRPVSIMDVYREIIGLCRRFRVVSVTYDTFQSAESIERLRSLGINAFETPYRNYFITQIYGELRSLVNEGDVRLYPHEYLIGEMKSLLYRISNRNIKRMPDLKSAYPTDDACDALAGAVYQALTFQVKQSLPKSKLVHTGFR